MTKDRGKRKKSLRELIIKRVEFEMGFGIQDYCADDILAYIEKRIEDLAPRYIGDGCGDVLVRISDLRKTLLDEKF